MTFQNIRYEAEKKKHFILVADNCSIYYDTYYIHIFIMVSIVSISYSYLFKAVSLRD